MAIIVFVRIIVACVWRYTDHSLELGSLGMMWVKIIGNSCPLSIEKKMRVVIWYFITRNPNWSQTLRKRTNCVKEKY